MQDIIDAYNRCHEYKQQYGVEISWSFDNFLFTITGKYGGDTVVKNIHLSEFIGVDVKRLMVNYEEIVLKGLSD